MPKPKSIDELFKNYFLTERVAKKIEPYVLNIGKYFVNETTESDLKSETNVVNKKLE